MLKVFALSAIAASAAAVEPLAVMQCQSTFAGDTGNACDALTALSKCFVDTGVNSLDASDPIRQLATNFLTGQQAKSDCTEKADHTLVRSERADMQFNVGAGDDDVKIYRFRRETVSLFDMSSRVAELEEQSKDLPAKLSGISAVADAAKKQAEANAEKLSADVDKAIADAAADIKDQGDDLDSKGAEMKEDASTARASLKSMLEQSISAGISGAKSDASAAVAAVAAQASSDSSKFKALEAAIAAATAAVAANKKDISEKVSVIVGWTQCQQTGSNGANHNNFVAMTCAYTKKRDDSYMHISVNSNQRQINGWSRWRFQVNSANSGSWRACSGPQNQGAGNIYTRYHGSRSVDLHRPMYVGGICWRTDNNQPIKKGRFQARWWQQDVSSDSYWNWESSARMILEERMLPN
jgi:hypothetical protein